MNTWRGFNYHWKWTSLHCKKEKGKKDIAVIFDNVPFKCSYPYLVSHLFGLLITGGGKELAGNMRTIQWQQSLFNLEKGILWTRARQCKKKKRYYCDCCTCRVGLHLLQSHTTCKLQPVLRCFCCSHFIPAAQERHAHAAMGNFIDAHIRSYRIHALKYACVYFQLTGSELECEDSLIFFSGR